MKSGSEKSPDRFFSFGKGVSSPCGGRAKRRQCPSAGKSCVSAVLPRAARIGEPNRPGRNMNQQRPTHGFRQRRRPCRRGEGMRRAGILRSVYVRTHDARNNRKIRPEICPNMRACADFLECFTPIPLEKQRNSFSNFENTPAFRAPSAQCGRFVRARRTVSGSRGAPVGAARACGARVFYVRCTSARMTRGITAKSVPKSAQTWALREIFLNFSNNFRFRCNEPAQNIVYIIYGHYFAPRNAPRAEPSCIRTRKIRIRSRASPSIYANLRTVSSKYVPKCAKPRRIPIKTVPICSLCPRSFPTGALMSRLCIKYALL